MNGIATFSLALALLPCLALAQTSTVTYTISSGTGFVVNHDGNVITNAHVVKDCQSMSILTPKGEEKASLVATDEENDLAVLKTSYSPLNYAPLRWNLDSLAVGDGVLVIGYPGANGAKGQQQFKKTKVKSLVGPSGESLWIQLESVAAHGNSGGPVLDDSGNVIAVVAGVAVTYQADKNNNPVGQPIGQSDIAITLPALRDFMREHAVSFYESGSTGRAYSDYDLRQNARNFIVPVRCIQNVTRR